MKDDAHPYAILAPENSTNYDLSSSMPSPRDREIRDLLLELSSEANIRDLVEKSPTGSYRILGLYAERAASITVRSGDVRELHAGLIANEIALRSSPDPREELPTFALLYRAAELIGLDPRAEFLAVNDLIGGNAKSIVDFANRAPENKTIQAMAFEEGNDDGGFRFIRTW